MYSVGVADWDVMALIGHRRVESTAWPRNKNLPHTCWMKYFPFLSRSGAVDDWVVYCFFAP